ncbi:MAG: ferritin-like domain-containing protein [Verrucomicrobiales bacterium]
MNSEFWFQHFSLNAQRNLILPLPTSLPCSLGDSEKAALARSLAIFQLGESGSGTRLKRYIERTRLQALPGYAKAINAFVVEEQSHAALLLRLISYLEHPPLEKQWTNSVFRTIRNLVNLEFNIQVLLTAELIAEVYFGALAMHTTDPAIRTVARKILRDEMGHLQFQREFLITRLGHLKPWQKTLWTTQFRSVHLATAVVVTWDHRQALRVLGWTPWRFVRRTQQAREAFLKRLWSTKQTHRLPSKESAWPQPIPTFSSDA